MKNETECKIFKTREYKDDSKSSFWYKDSQIHVCGGLQKVYGTAYYEKNCIYFRFFSTNTHLLIAFFHEFSEVSLYSYSKSKWGIKTQVFLSQ